MTVSIVIPTLNEERFIGRCLAGIREQLGPVEVIVVDGGSVDGTPGIAAAAGATVLRGTGTIARLRNLGVREARGDLLVFVDADVMVQPGYAEGLREVESTAGPTGRGVYGLNYDIRHDATWVERLMFDPATVPVRYIPAGNMVVPRPFFEELGGFDETLPTGEDYDLVTRARAAGAVVREVPRLRAVHEGYPRTVRQFVRREAWIGAGDFISWRTIRTSPVALATIAFLVLHAAVLLGWVVSGWLSLGALLALVLLCAALTAAKARGTRPVDLLPTALLWYFYLWGRAGAAWAALTGVRSPKERRPDRAAPPDSER